MLNNKLFFSSNEGGMLFKKNFNCCKSTFYLSWSRSRSRRKKNRSRSKTERLRNTAGTAIHANPQFFHMKPSVPRIRNRPDLCYKNSDPEPISTGSLTENAHNTHFGVLLLKTKINMAKDVKWYRYLKATGYSILVGISLW